MGVGWDVLKCNNRGHGGSGDSEHRDRSRGDTDVKVIQWAISASSEQVIGTRGSPTATPYWRCALVRLHHLRDKQGIKLKAVECTRIWTSYHLDKSLGLFSKSVGRGIRHTNYRFFWSNSLYDHVYRESTSLSLVKSRVNAFFNVCYPFLGLVSLETIFGIFLMIITSRESLFLQL